MHEIAAEKYVQLTTFTKDGRPKRMPVWIADLGDDRVGFSTELSSWKVKRIRATPTVELQPCEMRGKTKDGSSPIAGTATIVEGAEFDRVMAAIKAKYGWQVTLIELTNRVRELLGRRGGSDCGVVITLD